MRFEAQRKAWIWGKKIWGRKRHALVDTQGHLMQVKVTAASASDLAGARKLLEPLKDHFPRLRLLWGDSHDGGKLIGWVKEHLGYDIQVVRRLGTASDASTMESTSETPSSKPGFQPLPRRWVVERSFAWMTRLSSPMPRS